MNALLASVLLSLVSAVAYAAAAILQERIAATTAPSRYALLRRGRWWATVVLNGLGALLHVAALGLGPLTVVQPLGVLTIVLAAPMAALMVKRPVTSEAWRGILLVSVGLAAILLCTGAHRSRSLGEAEQFAVAAAAGALIVVLLGLAVAARGARRAGARSVALAMAAGVAFGTASVCVKAVAEGSALESAATALPVAGLIAAFAVTGLATSQASYRGGGLAAPLATSTVVNPVVAAAVGILLLDEGFRFGTAGALAALAGALVAGRGLVVLTGTGGGAITATAADAVAAPAEPVTSAQPVTPADPVATDAPVPADAARSTGPVVIPRPTPVAARPAVPRATPYGGRAPVAAREPRLAVPETLPALVADLVPDTVPDRLPLPAPH
ncbi:DMT family transporter [Streptomyces phytohabitans]|uniref:DMT family transporter n=1 Tax=Streptomyces phytohabitans TaxID=1150371 RepID=UPI00345C0F88